MTSLYSKYPNKANTTSPTSFIRTLSAIASIEIDARDTRDAGTGEGTGGRGGMGGVIGEVIGDALGVRDVWRLPRSCGRTCFRDARPALATGCCGHPRSARTPHSTPDA